MEKIAEILYQAYVNHNGETVYSKDYGETIQALSTMLNMEQRGKLLDLEIEIYETIRLRLMDLIMYLLKLICPEEEWKVKTKVLFPQRA